MGGVEDGYGAEVGHFKTLTLREEAALLLDWKRKPHTKLTVNSRSLKFVFLKAASCRIRPILQIRNQDLCSD